MKITRLGERVPSAKPSGYARLINKKLAFNKISTDGSGKTNIVYSKNNVVFGVLFDVEEKEILKLDSFEKGYERIKVTVLGSDNQEIQVFTYVSAQTNNNLKPYDWYLNLLIQGADENGLPKDYIEYLRSIETMPDTRKKK